MNEQESIQIIKDMMMKAKASHHRNSYYFIIWGVGLIIAGLTEFLVVHQMGNPMGYLGWMVVGIVGGILSGVFSAKESKRLGYEAFMDKVYAYTWGGFGASLVLLLIGSVINQINPIPLVLIATAIPTFVSSGITRFKPLLFGAFVFWIAGFASFFIPVTYNSLVFCGAVFLGYLLPGILLRNNEIKAHVQSA